MVWTATLHWRRWPCTGGKLSPSGKLCLLEPVHEDSVWFQERAADGIKVVSPVQLVLGLWHYRVRGPGVRAFPFTSTPGVSCRR